MTDAQEGNTMHKELGCHLFELDEQGKLLLFCLLGNMSTASEGQY